MTYAPHAFSHVNLAAQLEQMKSDKGFAKMAGVELTLLDSVRYFHDAGGIDAGAGEKGGMRVSVVGERSYGSSRMRRTWQPTAPAREGPEIPCMAAILLARRFARGEAFQSGAFPCMGFLGLPEFAPEFARWKQAGRRACQQSRRTRLHLSARMCFDGP